jgi:predicted esterase
MTLRHAPLLCLAACLAVPALAAAEDLPPIPPIPRVLPPEGIEIPADVRERLEARLAQTDWRISEVAGNREFNAKTFDEKFKWNQRAADVEIFVTAVDLALRHREFYSPKDFEKADWALDEANKRLDALERNEAPWEKAVGLVIRGYRSDIDDSAQPMGLVIPEDHDFAKPCPLYIWLHGRGDKHTNLHFLYERTNKPGQIAPSGAIVLHPFGRHCVGFKHAGEKDVLEASLAVRMRYEIDGDRIALMGFSMGGAGAWHLGAHHLDEYAVLCPGAGFVETARYQNLTPDKYPPSYEQTLWGMYDVPYYVRNLFNRTVIAYSGERDKQIQAARVMEEAYAMEGRQLTHLIGPGVGHEYEPKTLQEILRRVERQLALPPPGRADKLSYQTRTLQYSGFEWLSISELEEHWKDSRVDAEVIDDRRARIATKNIRRLAVAPFDDMRGSRIEIDGTAVEIKSKRATPEQVTPHLLTSWAYLVKENGRWREEDEANENRRCKSNWIRGPIDDAFMDEFTVVTPTGKSRNPRFQQWCEFELAHFLDRWRALMRAEPKTLTDEEFCAQGDLEAGLGNYVLWGDPDSNAAIKEAIQRLPVRFTDGKWTFGNVTYDGDRFVPVMIFPKEEHFMSNAIVLNSGLTFREGHDRTNSLQNPKLPDWAIIDITQPPDAFAPGRIHDAGFFDERWQLKSQPKGP